MLGICARVRIDSCFVVCVCGGGWVGWRAVAGVEVLELRIGMEKVAVLEAVLAVLAA